MIALMTYWELELEACGSRSIASCISSAMKRYRYPTISVSLRGSGPRDSRGNFDYVLTVQEDSLIAEKRAYQEDALIESGELVLSDGILQIKPQ